MMNRARLGLIVCMFTASGLCVQADNRSAKAGPFRLETKEFAISLNPANAAMSIVENKLTSDSKELRDAPFRLTTTRGEITPRHWPLQRHAGSETSATFDHSGCGLEVIVTYTIGDNNANALRKYLTLTNTGGETVTLFQVVMFDWTIPDHYN